MKKKPKAYTVYGHCNLTNGKWYVGMTSQNPKERWDSGWGYQKQPNICSCCKGKLKSTSGYIWKYKEAS